MSQKFLVEMHDGKKFVVEADSQPTEEEVMAHLGGQAAPAAPEGKSVPGFIGNTIASAGNLVGNAGKALVNVLNPNPDQNTVVGLGRTAMGVAQSALPANAVEGAAKAGIPDERRYADAAKNYVGSRYGSLKNIGDTLYNDPVGALADVSGLLTGTGEALDLGNVLAKSSALGKVADAAKVAGTVTDPLKAMRSMANTGLKLPSKLAERIITSNVKPPPSLVERNPTINIARVILDNKLKPGFAGAHQGRQLSKTLGDEVTNLAAADAPNTYSLDPLHQALLQLKAKYAHNPAGTDNVAAIDGAIADLFGNDLYAKDKFATQINPVQSAILGPNGQPVVTMVPQQVKVGRELIPQTASEINSMKRGIYEENPKAYGERKGATIQAEKAQGSELKKILDNNVAGVQDANAKNAGIITARKALNKMGVREENKYPLGLMDLVAAGAGAAGLAAGTPLTLPLTAAILLKHPTTAFPIARGLDKLGPVTLPASFARNLTPATQLSRATAGANVAAPVDRSQWDPRPDGTAKGDGFLGILRRPDGKVMSEYSIADSEKLKDAKGNYLDYPSLVPTLTASEVQTLLKSNPGDPIPQSIKDKAEAWALARAKAGKPLFAAPGEQQTTLYPQFQRATVQ